MAHDANGRGADRKRPRGADRRQVLLGLGVAAGGTLAGNVKATAAQAVEETQVTEAPSGHRSDAVQRVPFYGVHQAGIVTPRPANGMVVSFDVIADKPADLDQLLRKLTERILFLTQGGEPPALDRKLPPADSGILGPVVFPDNLTVTVGLGASLFEARPWLKSLKPRCLQRMSQFTNDALVAELCHGDLSLQFSANTPTRTSTRCATF